MIMFISIADLVPLGIIIMSVSVLALSLNVDIGGLIHEFSSRKDDIVPVVASRTPWQDIPGLLTDIADTDPSPDYVPLVSETLIADNAWLRITVADGL